MPNINKTFTKGRMNLDLDDRLVPNGEYREALNIQVSTSEDSDVGTVQNVAGNIIIQNGLITGSNAVCIGSISDEKNNRLFWFVHEDTGSQENSAILQYDVDEESVDVVLIDIGNTVLEFSNERHITAINIIDDFLFFTDGFSEPKKINVEQFKLNNHANTNIFSNSTSDFFVNSVSKGTVTKEDITVIKKKPTQAPVLNLIRTEQTLPVQTTTNTISFNLLDSVGNLINAVGDNVDINVPSVNNINVNDILLLKQPSATGVLPSSAQVRVSVNSINSLTLNCLILSVDSDVSDDDIAYDFVVEDLDTILFDKDFPRFAYRYKYSDGEYSAFSPFTQPAFLAGNFSMHPTREPYNLGMESRIKEIQIKQFVTNDIPNDVTEIELLYKSDNSNIVYSIDTIKPLLADGTTNNPAWHTVDGTNTTINWGYGTVNTGFNTGYYRITSDVIYSAIPSNQILRPYDNVPKKAKAQDFTANRLIYGNYVQNLKISDYDNNASLNYESRSYDGTSVTTFPANSIKSLRTYQAGIVYTDLYGRETPVFTSGENCSVTVPFEDNVGTFINSSKSNRLTLSNLSEGTNIQQGASDIYYFKIFVKETSSEYYNLVLDRVYKAEQDGNLWLSFPSSDRNKLQEDDFIILKKALDVDTAVDDPNNKFKVIDIQNEAPEFIRKKYLILGDVDGNNVQSDLFINSSFQPAAGIRTIILSKDQVESEIKTDLQKLFDRGKRLSLNFNIVETNSDILTSSRYEIISLTTTDSSTDFYTITLEEPIKESDSWIESSSGVLNTTLFTRISQEEIQEWEEFQGRFFVKILSNIATDNYLESQIGAVSNYTLVARQELFNINFGVQDDTLAGADQGYIFRAFMDSYYSNADINHQIDQIKNVTTPSVNPIPNLFKNSTHTVLNFNNSSVPSQGWFIDQAYTAAQQPTIESDWQKSGGLLREPPIAPGPDGLEFDASCSGVLLNQVNNLLGFNLAYQSAGGNVQNYYQSYFLARGGIGIGDNLGGPWSHDKAFSTRLIDGMQGIISTTSEFTNMRNGTGINDVSGFNNYFGPNGGAGIFTWKSQVGPTHIAEYDFTDTSSAVVYSQTGLPWTSSGIPTINVGETVYGPHGSEDRIYMHLSFSGVGVDLHDGSNLRAAGPNTDEVASYTGGTAGTGSKWAHNVAGTSKINLQSIENFNCQGDLPSFFYDIQNYPNVNTNGYNFINANLQAPINVLKRVLGVCDIPQQSSFNLEHKRNQWNPAYNNPGNEEILSNLVAGSKFKFTNDTNNTIFTIKSVTVKRLYNHTAWNMLSVPQDEDDATYVTDTVWDAWRKYKYLSTSSTIDNNLQVLKNRIKNFGAAHNRRVCYILELDKDPRSECSINPETLGGTSGTIESTFLHFFKNYVSENSTLLSNNPAVFETEPKENVDLDIYYEASDAIPYELDTNSSVDGGSPDNRKGLSFAPIGTPVRCMKPNAHSLTPSFGSVKVSSWDGDIVELNYGIDVDSSEALTTAGQTIAYAGAELRFFKQDGSGSYVSLVIKEAIELNIPSNLLSVSFNTIVKFKLEPIINKVGLDYYNCFSFGNGVESNRIRDDFNKPFIKNGVKASTTIEEKYEEDNRTSGLIFSGIYNKNTSVNNLNQFIMAEKITKELEPTYGSIQKLFARNSDLIALCEDKIVQIAADKDILFNADGNPQVVASDKVLGQSRPFVGEYGISKNPESFASSSYRAYFTDKQRGAVLRLSMDGLTPISRAGMKDWFRDKLRGDYFNLVGSYDKNKDSYNLTFDSGANFDASADFKDTASSITVTYKESDKGWSSFKSFIKESGVSAVNRYFTFREGNIYMHGEKDLDNVDISRNAFYESSSTDSFINVIFNESPSTVKIFNTLNYEGNGGWDCDLIETDLGFGKIVSTNNEGIDIGGEKIFSYLHQNNSFNKKENKYFASIVGEEIRGKDYTSFDFQGIGNILNIDIDE